jgi:hypothetical protein
MSQRVTIRYDRFQRLLLFIVLTVIVSSVLASLGLGYIVTGLGSLLIVVILLEVAVPNSKTPKDQLARDRIAKTTVNFALRDVESFLSRLTSHISGGFGTQEVGKVYSGISQLKQDGDVSFDFSIMVHGVRRPFTIYAYMDEVDAPDLTFMAAPHVLGLIEREYLAFADEHGL